MFLENVGFIIRRFGDCRQTYFLVGRFFESQRNKQFENGIVASGMVQSITHMIHQAPLIERKPKLSLHYAQKAIASMHILGLCNDSKGGNSEILLKIALSAAQESAKPETTTSWIHTPSVVILKDSSTLHGTTQSLNQGEDVGNASYNDVDDRQAFKNAILDADAIIVASTTHNRQSPGYLMDHIEGLDFRAAAAARKGKAGEDTELDERVLKPRILAFIATGDLRFPDQFSQVLLTLHQHFNSLHAKVVDQYVAKGCLASEAVTAVEQLGRNVASQLGKCFEDAVYLGPHEEGDCPYCHVGVFETFHTAGNEVGCVTCGAKGRLVVRDDGKILPEWGEDPVWSRETMEEKGKQRGDVAIYLEEVKAKIGSIGEEREKWRCVEIEEEALPSHAEGRGLQDG